MFDRIFLFWQKHREQCKKRYWYNQKNVMAHDYNRKKHVPELTEKEKKIIDQYWAQFGICFQDYSWFRCFKNVTGVFDCKFIPNDIYAYIIWPFYNTPYYIAPWKDKNYFERYLPELHFPAVIFRRIHGRYEDGSGKYLISKENIQSIFSYPMEVIVKDAWDSGEGRGVKKYLIKTNDDVQKLIKEWEASDNYLVQEVIKQHPLFASFNESSVNIIRITSWRHGKDVDILSPTLRFGTPGSATDVCFIDGVETGYMVGITDDGHFKNTIVSFEGNKTELPKKYQNEIIPRWDDILSEIKSAHLKLQLFDIIGWDVTVTNKGEIVFIEYNIKRPGTVFYQFANGPFWSGFTDEMLSFLLDKDNQKKYIPKWLKC